MLKMAFNSRISFFSLLLVAVLFFISFALTKGDKCIIQVDPYSTDTCSFNTSCDTVQGALSLAYSNDNCTSIELSLADGTYQGVGNTNVTFEDKLSVLAVKIYPTSQSAAKVIFNGDKTSQIFVFINATFPVVIKNITFLDGKGDFGGCISFNSLAEQSYLQLDSCLFQDCVADHSGGGVYMEMTGFSIVNQCQFVNNRANGNAEEGGDAEGGGGLSVRGGTVSISESLFSRNVGLLGGGLQIASPSFNANILTNTIFDMNHASLGGGMAVINFIEVSQVNFTSNTADLNGGAIYLEAPAEKEANMSYIVAYNNTAINGAALYVQDTNLKLDHAHISGNQAIGNGSGVYMSNTNNAIIAMYVNISDTTIEANHANGVGGGVYCLATVSKWDNLLVLNNTADSRSNSLDFDWHSVYCDDGCESAFCSSCDCVNCDSCDTGCSISEEDRRCLCYVTEDYAEANSCKGTPSPPGPPRKNHRARNITLGLLFGLILPLALIAGCAGLIIHRRRNRFATPNRMSSYQVIGDTENAALLR